MFQNKEIEFQAQPQWLQRRYEDFAQTLIDKGYPVDPELSFIQIAEAMFKHDLAELDDDVERLREKLKPLYVEAE